MQSCLIIQTAFFGDVILATGLIEQIRAAYPEVQIDMLVQKSREVLLTGHKHIRSILLLDKSRKFSSTLELIRTIRAARYDRVINVHRHGTSGLLTILSGAKETIGFDAHPMSRLFDRRVGHQRIGKHEIERNFGLVAHFIEDEVRLPRLYPSTEDYEAVANEGRYVTISPASVWETKRWPAAKWVELINSMPAELAVYLLGGPGDRALCDEIGEQSDHEVIIKAGEYSFLESAALMEHATMNYTNDSAPVHMATAMNAPVTALFCSTIPDFGYGPRSDERFIMEYDGELSCRPCGIHGHMACPKGHFDCSKVETSLVIQPLIDKLNSVDQAT